MEKTKGILGVNKKVVLKKTKKKSNKKKRLLKKVVDYLKSDFYMFAPLVSSPPSNFSPAKRVSVSSCTTRVAEALKPVEGGSTNLLNKVEEYLKSDLYMYAPLIDPLLSKVDSEVLKEIEQPSKGISKAAFNRSAVVRQTIARRETVKHVVHHNLRSSSLPDKEVLETRQRKLVK